MPRAPSRSSGTFGKSQSSMTSQPPKFAPVAQELRFMAVTVARSKPTISLSEVESEL